MPNDRAANATVGQTDDIAFHANDEFGIDVDRAEVVDQHRHAQAVVAVENAIEKRGLSGAEKAGDDRQRDQRMIASQVV